VFELIEWSIKLTVLACIATWYLLVWTAKVTIIILGLMAAGLMWCVREFETSRARRTA
jgi:hypothetical protein